MKTYYKTNLDPITYLYETYYVDIQISALVKTAKGSYADAEAKMKELGLKGIVVSVMHPNLKGKRDLHGKPYTPNEWIFTNRNKPVIIV